MTALGERTATEESVPGQHTVDVRCHRGLRGPYTGGGDLLRGVVPRLMAVSPALAARSAAAITAIAPDLAPDLPALPRSLTDRAPDAERTRFYPVQRTRDLAFTVSELIREWAQACHPDGVTLRFWELADADPTDTELFAMVCRRCGPAGVRAEDSGPLPQTDAGSDEGADLAQQFIDADGTVAGTTGAGAAQLAAYQALSSRERAARHSGRARLLIAAAQPGAQLGAIPYHLERGSDPAEAVPWLAAAQRQAFREGFYAAALDFGRRGRALLPRPVDPAAHDALTRRVISALACLGRCDEATEIIEEHRRATADAAEQMSDAYLMAMICARYREPARLDPDAAQAWANTALALTASAAAERRAFCAVFIRGAQALVELHRGDAAAALALANEAVGLSGELPEGTYLQHRVAALSIRARALLELGEHGSAVRACTEVLLRDPEQDEAYFERALAHQAHGDLEAALRDLDRAIELSPGFADAYYNRADIRLDLGQDELALDDLDAVLDIDPDHADALLNRAAALLGAGDLEAAQADIDRGLSLRPRSAHLWSALGLLRSEQGEADAALAAWATALSLNPELVEAYGNRAALHFAAGRPEAAAADLDQAIALRDTGPLRANRAIAQHALGNYAAAIADFDAALAMPGADETDVMARRRVSYHAWCASAPPGTALTNSDAADTP